MQNILMKFDPATGEERPYPSHAAQWRNWHGVAAWLFDPWTGKRRNAYDVGSDVHGLLIVPAGTLGGDTGCGASKQNKHEAGNDAQWPEPLWREVSMDDNYCTPLAAILRKAQGCIYRGTDEFIDVGGEVSELRRICDSQRATISRLRAELTEARKPDCRTCVYYYMPLRSCGARNGCTAGDAYSPASAPVRLYEKEEE